MSLQECLARRKDCSGEGRVLQLSVIKEICNSALQAAPLKFLYIILPDGEDYSRGIYKYNKLVVLKDTDMPAVLFECGIIKNRNEEVQLSNSKYQQKLVDTLFHAIENYFGLRKKNKYPLKQ